MRNLILSFVLIAPACSSHPSPKKPPVGPITLQSLESDIRAYRAKNGAMPERLDQLKVNPAKLDDHWGNPIGYTHNGDCFVLCLRQPAHLQEEEREKLLELAQKEGVEPPKPTQWVMCIGPEPGCKDVEPPGGW